MIKKLLKTVIYTSLLLVLLLGLIAGLTQTQFFRDRLRAEALSRVNTLLNASVYLGPLTGNLVTGFSIEGITVHVDGKLFLSASRVDLQYNLIQIPGRTLSIRSLSLINPVALLDRDRQGRWVFERMIRPGSPDTTSTNGRFDWFIDVSSLRIINGTVALVDSAALLSPRHGIPDPANVDYHQFTLSEINLTLRGSIGSEEKQLLIQDLSFASSTPDFLLEHLSADIRVSPEEAVIRDMVIRTGRSNLTLDCSLGEVDLLEGVSLERLEEKPVSLLLRADELDLDEFEKFLPAVSFLQGPVAVTLKAGGTFGMLDIDTLDIRLRMSDLHLSGNFVSLHEPDDIFMIVKMSDSFIHPGDPLTLLPEFGLPDLRSLGSVLVNLEYNGSPADFVTYLDLRTEAGAVESPSFAMVIGGPNGLRYDGDVVVHNLDLARLLENEALGSKLNADIHIEGEGTGLEGLHSMVQIQIDSSEFRGLPIDNSRIVARAVDQGVSGVVRFNLGDMESLLTAELLTGQEQAPRFVVDGNVASLNLAHLFHDPLYDSDLTMEMQVKGTGLTGDSLALDAFFDLSSSRYGTYSVDSGKIHLLLDQRDPQEKTLDIKSTVADISLRGTYDLEQLRDIVEFEAAHLGHEISARYAAFDSSVVSSADREMLDQKLQLLEGHATPIDATYEMAVKDLEVIPAVARTRSFDGAAMLNGWIKGDHSDLSLGGDLRIEEFFYGSADSGILILDGESSFEITGLRSQNPLESMATDLRFRAGRILINRTAFDSVSGSVKYDGGEASYVAAGVFDGNLRFDVRGGAQLTHDSLGLGLSALDLAYRGYDWSADPGISVSFLPTGARVQDVVFRRDSQSVRFDFSVVEGGVLEGNLLMERLDLDDFKYLLSRGAGGSVREAFSGSGSVSVAATGTLDHPVFDASFRAEDLAFRGIPAGRLDGRALYEDALIDLGLLLQDPADSTGGIQKLKIAGTLPVDLALIDVQDRLPDRPLQMRIQATDFHMSILDPLLPTFSDMVGRLDCDVTLGGTLRIPAAEGTIQVEECLFLFVPNNIYYSFSGDFRTEGDRIQVVEATVSNTRGDERGGRLGQMRFTGDFSMKNLRPGDFDLWGTGDLLVVKQTTRTSELSVSGNLFVEITEPGLHFTGSIDQSLLRGNLLIRNSSLIFPPTQAPSLEKLAFSIPVSLVDDTTTADDSGKESAAARYFGGAASGGPDSTDVSTGTSFMDGLQYDLNIETSGGTTEIRMVFNPISGEELVARLNGEFSITEDGQKWFGDLTVDRAYYNFLKRFDAEGRIMFRGDLLNPALDIAARYRGTRVVRDSVAERTEDVIVTFKITGPRVEPKVEYFMTIDEIDYLTYNGPKSNDVQSDAIQFIVYGSFPITAAERSDVPSEIQKTVGLSILTGATSMLTGTLSEFLRNQTGFINSVEFKYAARGSITESADIRLSGVAWNGFWRYGGQILDDPLSNANFSLLYSFDAIFQDPSLRNLMIELERRVEMTPGSQKSDLKRVNSARLFYRFSF
jgi:hypothetical protein